MSTIMIGDKACEKCEHARPERTDGKLTCRRFPPQVHMLPVGNGKFSVQNVFPLVEPTWSCGEYKFAIALAKLSG